MNSRGFLGFRIGKNKYRLLLGSVGGSLLRESEELRNLEVGRGKRRLDVLLSYSFSSPRLNCASKLTF